MKKYITVTALLAAGTAFANADVAPGTTVVFDFGRSNGTTNGAINISKDYSGYKSDYEVSGSLEAMSGNYVFWQEGTTGGMSNIPTATTSEEPDWKNPLTEVPEGWESSFADALTSQCQENNGDTFKLTFSGLTAGYYDLSVLGGYSGKDNIVSSVTLTLSDATFTGTTWSADDLGGDNTASATGVETLSLTTSNGSGNEGYLFDVSRLLVGEAGTLTVTIDGASSYGARTPLNGLKLTYVEAIPEPSAFGLLAGLGALALVGARRRRK